MRPQAELGRRGLLARLEAKQRRPAAAGALDRRKCSAGAGLGTVDDALHALAHGSEVVRRIPHQVFVERRVARGLEEVDRVAEPRLAQHQTFTLGAQQARTHPLWLEAHSYPAAVNCSRDAPTTTRTDCDFQPCTPQSRWPRMREYHTAS
jgi:hypothetical protein